MARYYLFMKHKEYTFLVVLVLFFFSILIIFFNFSIFFVLVGVAIGIFMIFFENEFRRVL